MAGSTGFEPATSGLTVQCANQAAPRARRGTSRGYTAAFDNATTPYGWMRRGLRLGRYGHVVAGFSPPAAAAVDDPDVREAHLPQRLRAQGRLAPCPARQEDLLSAVRERRIAARQLRIRLDLELAARDVARAGDCAVLGDLPRLAHVDQHRGTQVDDRLRLLRADDLDLATGLPDHLPKRLSHVPIPRGDGPGFRARADARRARCSRRSRGSLTGPRQAV